MHSCEKCGQDFKYKYLLDRHKTNKKPCDTDENINSVYNKKIKKIDDLIKTLTEQSLNTETKCLFCNKNLSSRSNTQRHMKNFCDEKKKLLKDKDNLIEEINKLKEKDIIKIQNQEIKELKKMMEKMMKKQPPNNQIINNNNTINNNNLIVNINSYGKEDLSHITLDDYKKYLNGFFPGFIKFIKKIHFDADAPGNHNICITNIKSKYMYVYEDNEWVLKDKSDTLDRLISRKYNLLVNKCDELEENKEINTKIIENFREFEENYGDNEAQSNTKKDVMLMIYSNKDKINVKTKTKLLEV